ncbi:MAG: DegT/DnrJ/EryC1/StrS family aminotransferase, partial [Phycisphaerales bacterium]|nr:DegT/DnrJ/EryC1/StrS family aminotransferase [Phycisphaerales bacterium]
MSEIPLSRPDITDAEINAVVETLRSGRLSIGPRLQAFEDAVARRASCRHAVGVSSGTAGLHLVMRALGIGPGDEVITTPFSFVASANAILYVGAKPVFVDIDTRTLNMVPALVERAVTPRTRAILAVDVFGNPTHMDRYASIAAQHEIPLIEDCCEALGSTLRGRPAGSFGRVGVFGFYPNKQITTGEGGMIVTDDERLANACRSMRNQGRPVDAPTSVGLTGLLHVTLGYNYRLSEIAAAMGVEQMARLDQMLERRRAVANAYIERLAGNTELVLPTMTEEASISWFVFVVRLSTEYAEEERDRILSGLLNHEIGAATYFPPIHLQPFYRSMFGFERGAFPVTESVASRTIALPF